MSINWVYFSDIESPPGEIKKILEKQQYHFLSVQRIEMLHPLLKGNTKSVLFLEANTRFNVYDLCQEISALYPYVYIILIVPEESENLKSAMLNGASDTLRSNYDIGELSEAVAHAKKFMHHRATMEPGTVSLLIEKCRVIAVSSPKGGVGRTVLTVNLAVAFAKMGKKVAVIDGNLQFGEVGIYYNVKPKRTIYEWVKEGYARPNYSINQYMTLVDGSVSVLAAPLRPEFFEGISEKHMTEAIDEAKKIFDIILIDMPVYLSEIHLRCLDLTDDILLLAINEIPGLRLCQLYLDTLESINLKDKVKLVLNRYSKGQGLEMKKIKEILSIDVYHTLPDQFNIVSSSIKTGQPYLLSNPRSTIGKAVLQLTEKLSEQKSDGLIEVKKEKKWFHVGK
ncbi:AAA family ATPase [Neobacillus citreus]|uniref:AAA family ATPase n=1 Tax=Neobacillus citreus TaxID=2833578 RepID=A0A942YAB4_9BACI|nr:AAA family ATPase [Neobacillus citreus]MCH6267627.1 AAA family ATPase [Neobacillus citreus]